MTSVISKAAALSGISSASRLASVDSIASPTQAVSAQSARGAAALKRAARLTPARPYTHTKGKNPIKNNRKASMSPIIALVDGKLVKRWLISAKGIHLFPQALESTHANAAPHPNLLPGSATLRRGEGI
jgi:hypothetical protein